MFRQLANLPNQDQRSPAVIEDLDAMDRQGASSTNEAGVHMKTHTHTRAQTYTCTRARVDEQGAPSTNEAGVYM